MNAKQILQQVVNKAIANGAEIVVEQKPVFAELCEAIRLEAGRMQTGFIPSFYLATLRKPETIEETEARPDAEAASTFGAGIDPL